jgi:hypothetical protein
LQALRRYGSSVEVNILNLGCGDKRIEGATNVDVNPRVKAEIVHDLNRLPWPLPDDRFETVQMADSIEHLKNVVSTMDEVHRVCKNGAVVKITTPHFSSSNSFTDPTHLHHLGYFSFDYFTGQSDVPCYGNRRFRHRSIQIVFNPSLVNKIAWRLANRFPRAYERRWAWLFPAWFLFCRTRGRQVTFDYIS